MLSIYNYGFFITLKTWYLYKHYNNADYLVATEINNIKEI